jgi:hypothetical protein
VRAVPAQLRTHFGFGIRGLAGDPAENGRDASRGQESCVTIGDEGSHRYAHGFEDCGELTRCALQAEKLSYDAESLRAQNQLLKYRLEALQVCFHSGARWRIAELRALLALWQKLTGLRSPKLGRSWTIKM